MKLKNILMVAALVAGGVLAADMTASAQDATTNTPPAGARPPGGPRGGGRFNFDNISAQLALTDDQKTKAKPIFEEMAQKMAELRRDTSLDQTERRSKAKEIRDDATTKLKGILTEEQLNKWKKMGGRRPAGGEAPAPAANPKPQQ
jgi:uncharacterized protein YdeI (BOF family)